MWKPVGCCFSKLWTAWCTVGEYYHPVRAREKMVCRHTKKNSLVSALGSEIRQCTRGIFKAGERICQESYLFCNNFLFHVAIYSTAICSMNIFQSSDYILPHNLIVTLFSMKTGIPHVYTCKCEEPIMVQQLTFRNLWPERYTKDTRCSMAPGWIFQWFISFKLPACGSEDAKLNSILYILLPKDLNFMVKCNKLL